MIFECILIDRSLQVPALFFFIRSLRHDKTIPIMAEKDPDQRRTRILYLESGFSIFMLVHVYSLYLF